MNLSFSANNFAMQHKRKTISGNDVIEAMKEMDFDRFVEPLQHALEGNISLECRWTEVLVCAFRKYSACRISTQTSLVIWAK